MSEDLILVDIFDREAGTGEKLETHRNGWLHRAFSVFLYQDNKMLIQKRNEKKYHSGGLWANACCSHPRVGETLEEAVPRRMFEEIGVSTSVNEIFSFVYRQCFADGLSEYEYDHVFLGKYLGKITLNEEEASEALWIDIDELSEDLSKNPGKYCAWFLIAAPKVIEEIKKRQSRMMNLEEYGL